MRLVFAAKKTNKRRLLSSKLRSSVVRGGCDLEQSCHRKDFIRKNNSPHPAAFLRSVRTRRNAHQIIREMFLVFYLIAVDDAGGLNRRRSSHSKNILNTPERRAARADAAD